MAHGNIYPAEQSTPRSPTTSGPATSPRCASSRCCGSPTGSRSRSTGYLDAHGITETWETRERVVVGHHRSPGGEAVIRRAARMAGRDQRRPARRARRVDDGSQPDPIRHAGGAAQARHRARWNGARGRRPRSRRGAGGSSPAARRRRSSCSARAAEPADTRSSHGSFVARVTRLAGRSTCTSSTTRATTFVADVDSRRGRPVCGTPSSRRLAAAGGRASRPHRRDAAVARPHRAVDRAAARARRGARDRRARRGRRRRRGRHRRVAARQLVLRRPVPHLHDRRVRERHRPCRLRRGRRHRRHAGRLRLAARARGRAGPGARPRRWPVRRRASPPTPTRSLACSSRSTRPSRSVVSGSTRGATEPGRPARWPATVVGTPTATLSVAHRATEATIRRSSCTAGPCRPTIIGSCGCSPISSRLGIDERRPSVPRPPRPTSSPTSTPCAPRCLRASPTTCARRWRRSRR